MNNTLIISSYCNGHQLTHASQSMWSLNQNPSTYCSNSKYQREALIPPFQLLFSLFRSYRLSRIKIIVCINVHNHVCIIKVNPFKREWWLYFPYQLADFIVNSFHWMHTRLNWWLGPLIFWDTVSSGRNNSFFSWIPKGSWWWHMVSCLKRTRIFFIGFVFKCENINACLEIKKSGVN